MLKLPSAMEISLMDLAGLSRLPAFTNSQRFMVTYKVTYASSTQLSFWRQRASLFLPYQLTRQYRFYHASNLLSLLPVEGLTMLFVFPTWYDNIRLKPYFHLYIGHRRPQENSPDHNDTLHAPHFPTVWWDAKIKQSLSKNNKAGYTAIQSRTVGQEQ